MGPRQPAEARVPHRNAVFTALGALAVVCLAFSTARAVPPVYESFDREQRIEPFGRPGGSKQAPDGLMRIWMIECGQGEAVLIQLPQPPGTNGERVDVLVDGGNSRSNHDALRVFLHQVYREPEFTIENVVLTHSDDDRISGLIPVLDDDAIRVQSCFHNGLASYNSRMSAFTGTKPLQSNVLVDMTGKTMTRGLAHFDQRDGRRVLERSHFIYQHRQLANAYAGGLGELTGKYEALAAALQKPGITFGRTWYGGPFIQRADIGSGLDKVSFSVLWPRRSILYAYGEPDVSETHEGNSITFRMEYGDFSMVFGGDHTARSLGDLLTFLQDEEQRTNQNQMDLLKCDVLKLPSHGGMPSLSESDSDVVRKFIRHAGPVVSLASMGEFGFDPKTHQQPSDLVIRWAGMANRVYCTHIHEAPFTWKKLQADWENLKPTMKERKHVLVETDGRWFRVVEVPVDSPMLTPENVVDVHRGDGTRWIRCGTQ